MVSRLKLQYCKVIIATSLVWFMLDVFLLMYYTDCNMAEPCERSDTGKHGSAGGKQESSPAGILDRLIPNGKYLVR